MRSVHRVGFTLVELLVVIAIIGILVALLLPAVQAAREAARRMQCSNNLKQLALAVHTYADANQSFPSGYICNASQAKNQLGHERSHWSWGALVLPFIEQKPLHDQLQVGPRPLWVNLSSATELAALRAPIQAFVCPSDPGPALNDFNEQYADNPADPNAAWYDHRVTPNGTTMIAIAKSNYVGVAETNVSTTPPVDPVQYGPPGGVFFQNSGTKFGDITDGTSNTLMLGERAWKVGTLIVGAGNALGFSSETNTQSASAGIKAAQMAVLGICYNGINQTAINRVHQTRGFYSTHPGGAQFALCDGGVRFISATIDYRYAPNPSPLSTSTWCYSVFAWLCHKSDGRSVGADW